MSSSDLPPIGPWRDDGRATGAGNPFSPTTPSAVNTATGGRDAPAHAPIGFLLASLAASAAALVLAALFEHPGAAIAAWALAGLGGLGLTVVFLVRDARRHSNPLYLTTRLPVWLYRVCVPAALLGVVAASVRIALFVGRM
ncbi:hypothetical protein [Actinomyces sp. oral taxon 414]|uniref:hypothetical protein n=1 Tax=Actinomyces sp. oral taxon 414 TaxID=712122 RepID=UPI0006AE0A1D|nr:hypothetical protein [Actinomyces sp. oral taxon 414]